MKMEHAFLEMINAAVSHELRNPLNSLIGQVTAMKQHFKEFRKVIGEMQGKVEDRLLDRLQGVHDGLHKCGQKMSTACQFIDFFVHDILDYTILNKDSRNFMKDCKSFYMSSAIQEIRAILEDKVSMKEINVKVEYRGFTRDCVNTDKKRMQQVLLNLLSNAVKFTDR